MKITYLKLINFKRFPLNEIEVFEKKFIDKLILITGPNGVGKSSLINELTPLPSDKNNFTKKGYKEIHIEKDNKKYILISDFREGAKFYFKCDDEELNLSNKVTTQKDLVYQHFNINPYIHDMLVGVENFTDMSLLSRKKLFNSITHLNIDDILKNYNKLKEELKNNEYLLKNQLSLLQVEEQKISNENHIKSLLETNDRIKRYIDILLDIRTHLYKYKSDKDIDAVYEEFSNLYSRLRKALSKYYTYLTSYPSDNLDKYTSKLEVLNYKLDDVYKQIEKKEEDLKLLNLTKENNLDELTERLKEINNSINSYKKELSILTDIDIDLTSVKEAIYRLETTLPDILRTIPTNKNKEYSIDLYKKKVASKDTYHSELNNLILEELEIRKELTHLKEHRESITCPNCSHTWLPEDTERKIQELTSKLNQLLERKAFLQKEIKHLEEDIQKQLSYIELYKSYSHIRSLVKDTLKPFWSIVDSNNYIFTNPVYILQLLKEVSMDVNYIESITSLQREYTELNNKIKVMLSVQDNDVASIESSIVSLNSLVKELQLEKNEVSVHIQNNKIANKVRSSLNSLQSLIEASREEIYNSNTSYTIEKILSLIEAELSKYKVILIENDKEITNYNNIKYTISNYQRQIEDINSNIKVLKIILNELSPKNGLIARSISSFLNIIITNINNIINSIWDYKMILKPINVETDALNYKFKVEVEDKIVIDDINKVSSGMKEVINLSFKMVLYKLLRLEYYPIYLDEFGVRLDKTHRSRISDLIFKMINSDNYSQIFLITHLDMAYNVFKEVEVLELG
jgi:DNA repair exonuclease SbcCD ATPase subunit